MRLGLSLGLRWTCPRHGQETFLRANLRSREYPRANSVIPMTDQRCAEFEDAKRKREGREADEEYAHVGQPLPSAQVEDLLEDLLAVSVINATRMRNATAATRNSKVSSE